MADVSYLTQEGLENLKAELDDLKGPARQKLSERLRLAIQQGDLSENADYIQAKEDQGFLEGRILELEQLLRNVVIIDDTVQNRDKVEIGAHVTIQEGSFPEETYYLVGPKEADPRNGRISHESPIGKALLGHQVGDEVLVDTPGGSIRLNILRIE
ncbi:transcription elongation factor GreA [Longilinea arvoryzae]|uniref:Transcription elongation factor GreA n=1 Tax=Longilinea arvoryzae TaxID=360412 RepID=A0A0S7BKW1_9CHLR|nr:transcription elongation factor GreA [Longilinea arvoryzae]GAP14405.1 transcription elongation factor GreA [Longilinea arvoryzae]